MSDTIDFGLLLLTLKENGGTGNLMDALSWNASRFDEGFAIANEMQNRDLVKLLYSNYNKNLIVVELTLVGVHYQS